MCVMCGLINIKIKIGMSKTSLTRGVEENEVGFILNGSAFFLFFLYIVYMGYIHKVSYI